MKKKHPSAPRDVSPNNVEFVRMLICSTVHVPPSMEKVGSSHFITFERHNPDRQAIVDTATATGTYGWLVHAERTVDQYRKVPKRDREAFKKLLDFAQLKGFVYVLFDADADPIEGFKKYRR